MGGKVSLSHSDNAPVSACLSLLATEYYYFSQEKGQRIEGREGQPYIVKTTETFIMSGVRTLSILPTIVYPLVFVLFRDSTPSVLLSNGFLLFQLHLFLFAGKFSISVGGNKSPGFNY